MVLLLSLYTKVRAAVARRMFAKATTHIVEHSTYVVRNLNRVRDLNIVLDLNIVRDLNIKWQPLTAGFKAVSPFPALT